MFSKKVMGEINTGLSQGRKVFNIDGQHMLIDRAEGTAFNNVRPQGPAGVTRGPARGMPRGGSRMIA